MPTKEKGWKEDSIKQHTSSPIKTTFSPRITYRPKGMSQYKSPTITRSQAPSRTTLAVNVEGYQITDDNSEQKKERKSKRK